MVHIIPYHLPNMDYFLCIQNMFQNHMTPNFSPVYLFPYTV